MNILRAALIAVACLSASASQSRELDCEVDGGPGACTAAGARQALGRIKTGTHYKDVRRRMMAWDFMPVPTGGPRECQEEFENTCRLYPETLSCSVTNDGDCKFVFRLNDSFLVINTLGQGDDQKLFRVDRLSLQERKDLEASLKR